jgi:hypothetical protein
MKPIYSKILIVLLAITLVFSFIWSGKNELYVDFYYDIPRFDNNQIEIIRKTKYQIDQIIRNPNSYFISEVIQNDTTVLITILPMSFLQAFQIKYKNSHFNPFAFLDDNYEPNSFVFNNKYNLIKKYKDQKLLEKKAKQNY